MEVFFWNSIEQMSAILLNIESKVRKSSGKKRFPKEQSNTGVRFAIVEALRML